MRRRPASLDPAIEGRAAIAQALSGIMGVPVSLKALDCLIDRRRHPLPVHGYPGRKWAFLVELQEWWADVDECGRRERDEVTE